MRKVKVIYVLGLLYFFVCGMFFFGADGYAYVDPSVITYVIQAVAGAAIAAGAGIGFYIRKIKRKIDDAVGMDESVEVESDDIMIKDEP